jgi:hypothetical protein
MMDEMIDPETAKFIDAWMDDSSEVSQLVQAKVANGYPKGLAVRQAAAELGYAYHEVSLERE